MVGPPYGQRFLTTSGPTVVIKNQEIVIASAPAGLRELCLELSRRGLKLDHFLSKLGVVP